MREIQYIDIELDKPRRMALPLGALRRAEREINRQRAIDGKPETSIFRITGDSLALLSTSGEIMIELMVVMLWASLLHEDKDLTIEQVESSLPDGLYCTKKVIECMAVWMQSPKTDLASEEAGGDAPVPLAQHNGLTSGPVVDSTSD